jgi:hypothetical protein
VSVLLAEEGERGSGLLRIVSRFGETVVE